MATVQQDALARAKVKQEKEMKARQVRDEKIGKSVHSPAIAPKDQKGVSPVPMPTPTPTPPQKAGDQNDVNAPPSAPEKTKTKKPKKASKTVIAWKELENFPADAKISIIAKTNPKRRDAARRFAFYKDGMTVLQYLTVTKENGITNALANADIRWDHAAGHIKVTAK